MELTEYCDHMGVELTEWKAKMYDIVLKLDKLGTHEREGVLPLVEDLHILVEDMAARIGELETECSTEWDTHKRSLADAHVDMRAKFEETMDYIGKAAPVSVPG